MVSGSVVNRRGISDDPFAVFFRKRRAFRFDYSQNSFEAFFEKSVQRYRKVGHWMPPCLVKENCGVLFDIQE